MSSEKEHLTAVLALMGGTARGAYSLDDLAKYKTTNGGVLPSSYNEVMVMERFPDGPSRGSEPSETGQWRILTRAVAQNYSNAQEMRRRAGELRGKSATVGGQPTTEIERLATDDPIAPDDGWFSGASEFGYAL